MKVLEIEIEGIEQDSAWHDARWEPFACPQIRYVFCVGIIHRVVILHTETSPDVDRLEAKLPDAMVS